MNTYELKINGIIEIDGEIDSETEYGIALDRIQQKDGMVSVKDNNQEGKTYQYKMVNLGGATLVAEGTVIRGEAKQKSISRALRFVIEEYFEQQHSGDMDREVFYQKEVSKIIEQYKNKLI